MNVQDLHRRILEVAVHAPSGDNAQPWKFKLDGSAISIFNIPNCDATPYNFLERGSYLAHGALAENISIAASHHGFNAIIEPFPGEAECTARTTFKASNLIPDSLYDCITKRATNRKPYDKRPLEPAHREALNRSVDVFSEVSVRFLEGNIVQELAPTISLNERLLFENRDIHDAIFGMIRWSAEEERVKPGLYVRTMELPLPVRFLFKYIFHRFSAVRILNCIGLSRAIPKTTAQLYASSAAFGTIIVGDETHTSYFTAGRALERLWLTATKIGVRLQPITAIPYLASRIRAGQGAMFSKKHQNLILAANDRISESFALGETERIAMLFRIGYGPEPSAVSRKEPPEIVV